MLFNKKSVHKTKHFFLKTLKNLKIIPYGNYINLPKTLFVNPLSCIIITQRTHDQNLIICSQFSEKSLNVGHSIIIPSNDTNEEDHSNAKGNQVLSPPKINPNSTTSSVRYANDGACKLAEKMKELDMLEVENEDQALDVEDALCYYSLLSCPVYVDIVDKFFLDMYQEFLVPQPSVSLRSSSSGRLGPLSQFMISGGTRMSGKAVSQLPNI